MSLKATEVHSIIAAGSANSPPRVVMPAVAGSNGYAVQTLFPAWAILLSVKASLGLDAALDARRHIRSVYELASNGRALPVAPPDPPKPQTRAQRRRERQLEYERSAQRLEKLRSHPGRD